MRAVEITRYGGPEVLRVTEVAKPAAPGAYQVLVHVAAAGVNPVDWKARDVVLDGVGPEAQARSWKLLRRGGILVSLVAPPAADVAERHAVRGTMVYGSPNAADLAEVNALVAKGDVKIHVSHTYPVAQAAAALGESQAGQVQGKLVLTF